jgi:hypothetical protein
MPRGSKDGSLFQKPASGDGRPAIYIVRKRYLDASGRRREKKRVAHSDEEALTLKREIAGEIAAELAGVSPNRSREFGELVKVCNFNLSQPDHMVVTLLLALRDAATRNNRLVPEFSTVDLKAYCTMENFEPAAYASDVLQTFHHGLCRLDRMERVAAEICEEVFQVDIDFDRPAS